MTDDTNTDAILVSGEAELAESASENLQGKEVRNTQEAPAQSAGLTRQQLAPQLPTIEIEGPGQNVKDAVQAMEGNTKGVELTGLQDPIPQDRRELATGILSDEVDASLSKPVSLLSPLDDPEDLLKQDAERQFSNPMALRIFNEMMQTVPRSDKALSDTAVEPKLQDSISPEDTAEREVAVDRIRENLEGPSLLAGQADTGANTFSRIPIPNDDQEKGSKTVSRFDPSIPPVLDDTELPLYAERDQQRFKLILGDMPRSVLNATAELTENLLNIAAPVRDFVRQFAPQFIAADGRIDFVQLRNAKPEDFNFDKLGVKTEAGSLATELLKVVGAVVAANSLMQFVPPVGPLAAVRGIGTVVLTGVFLFSGREVRNADVLAKVPGLDNSVVKFLQSNDEDSIELAKIKAILDNFIPAPLAPFGRLFLQQLQFTFRQNKLLRQIFPALEGIADTGKKAIERISPLGILEGPAVMRLLKKNDLAEGFTKDAGATFLREGLVRLDGKTFLNFARIDGPREFNNVLSAIKNARKGNLGKTSKGALKSDGKLGDIAGVKLTVKDKKIFSQLLSERTGAKLKPSDADALAILLKLNFDKTAELARRVAIEPSAANVFALRRSIILQHVVQKNIRGDTGRITALFADMKVPARTGTAATKFINQAVGRLGGSAVNLEIAKRVSGLAGDLRQRRVLFRFIEKLTDVTNVSALARLWADAVLEVTQDKIRGQLVGQTNNTKTNLELGDPETAGRISHLVGPRQALALQEAHAKHGALIKSFGDALRVFAHKTRAGTATPPPGVADPNAPLALQGAAPPNAAPELRPIDFSSRYAGLLGTFSKRNGANLPNEFADTLGYRMELHAAATRTATRELRSGQITRAQFDGRVREIVANPPAGLRLKTADRTLFDGATRLTSEQTKSLMSLSRQFPSLKFMLPLANAEQNFQKYDLQNTPFAGVMAHFRTEVAAGGSRREVALTKMSAGTAIMFTLIDMALNGTVTGGGPAGKIPGKGIRKGKQAARAYSIRLGGRSFQYDRTSRLGAHICLTADLVEVFMNTDMDEVSADRLQELAIGVTAAISTNVTDQAYLRQLSETLVTAANPEDNLEEFLTDAAGDFIAKPGRGNRRGKTGAADGFIRQSFDWMQGIKAKMPGVTKDAPKPRDEFGRDYQYRSGLNGGFSTASPIYDPAQTDAPIDREVRKQGFNIQPVEKVIRRDGDQFFLRGRPDIVSRLQELRGQVVRLKKYGGKPLFAFLNDLVSGKSLLSATYNMASDGSNGGKGAMIHCIINDYQDAAEDKLVEEFSSFFNSRQRRLLPMVPSRSLARPEFAVSP